MKTKHMQKSNRANFVAPSSEFFKFNVI